MALTQVYNTSVLAGGGTRMFTLSNGNAMMIAFDNSTLRAYETSAADRKTGWTSRMAVAVPTGNLSSVRGITGTVDASNNLHILVWGDQSSDSTQRIYYYKLTYVGYSASAATLLFSVPTATGLITGTAAMDIDVSASGGVFVSIVYSTGQVQPTLRILVQPSGGAFAAVAGGDVVLSSGVGTTAGDYMCSIMAMGGSNTARRFAVATHIGFFMSTPYTFSDQGVDVRAGVVNETTGALSVAYATSRYTTVNGNVSYPGKSRGYKVIKLYRSAIHADMIRLAIMCGTSYVNGQVQNGTISGSSNNASVHAMSWDGTTFTAQTKDSRFFASPQGAALGLNNNTAYQTLGITHYDSTTDASSIVFSYASTVLEEDTSVTRVGQTHAMISPQFFPNIYLHTGLWMDGATDGEVGVWNGETRLPDGAPRHDTLVMKSDLRPYHWMSPTPPSPTAVSPDNGQSVTSATPDLAATTAYTDAYWAPAKYTFEWQIAPDNTFTTGTRIYNNQEIFAQGVINQGQWNENTGGFADFSGTVSTPKTIGIKTSVGYSPLAAGTWYIRARTVGSDGTIGAWTTATRIFTIGHPPTGVPVAPLNNQMFDYGAGTKAFTWDFSDPSLTDVQTAYQLRIRTADAAGTIIYDSGKVTSAVKTVTVSIPSGNKNMTLYWEVKLWDSDNAAGLFSTGDTYFQMIDPATASITAPTANQTLSSATPTFSATVSATGARTVKQYLYRIYQAGQMIWASNPVLGTWSNGQALTQVVPSGILKNNSQYSVQIVVLDDAGVASASNTVTFSTSWTAAVYAGTITADATAYNTDGAGYVTVSWTDASRESGFVRWNIYRRTVLTDVNTGALLSVGAYELVWVDSRAQAGTYTWNDYLAPAGQRLDYLVTQVADRGGFLVESENTTYGSVSPSTDGYWLIDNSDSSNPQSMKLALTTADSFTDEQEEVEYIVIGRGRHVDKGEYLGVKGSLTLQLRDSVVPQTVTVSMNGTFETDISGWAVPSGDATLARSTAQKRSGVASLQITDGAATDVNRAQYDPLPASPGRAYHFKAYIGAFGNAALDVFWYDASGTLIRTDSSGNAFGGSGTSFTQRTIDVTAPLEAATYVIRTNAVSTPAGGITYVDDVSVVVDDYVGTSARQKRLNLLAWQQKNEPLYLRNPFGDVYKVNVSSMQVGRLAGVGKSEFCDVTVPYSQVG